MRKLIFASLLLLLIAISAAAGSNFGYLFSRDGNTIISGNIDVDRILSVNKRFGAPYLWARVDGRQYLITDAATLNQAEAAFAEVNAFRAENERLDRKMDPLEEREEELEERIDRITDAAEDDGEPIDRGQLNRLRAELREVARQLRDLEREEERIDRRTDALADAAEKKLQGIIERAIDRGLARSVR
jgi:prefoldin subunit 5